MSPVPLSWSCVPCGTAWTGDVACWFCGSPGVRGTVRLLSPGHWVAATVDEQAAKETA